MFDHERILRILEVQKHSKPTGSGSTTRAKGVYVFILHISNQALSDASLQNLAEYVENFAKQKKLFGRQGSKENLKMLCPPLFIKDSAPSRTAITMRCAVRRTRLQRRLWFYRCSVADPGCLSRILIFTQPGSRIQKKQQKRGVNKI